MKRNRIIIPVVALLSHTMYAQTPVDMNLQLQNVEIQGKRIAGLNGGEVKRLQVDKNEQYDRARCRRPSGKCLRW